MWSLECGEVLGTPYGPGSCSVAIPIDTYGVVMTVTYASKEPKMFLYKHAAGPAAAPLAS